MVRSRSPLLLPLFVMALGCGGRDPLDGPIDDGTGAPPANGGAGGGGADASRSLPSIPGTTPPSTAPPNTPPTMPPPLPDAGAVGPARDGGRPRDAAPAPPAVSCAPKCIAALQAECTPSGSCVQQRTGRGGGPTCYANGVKFLPAMGTSGAGTRVLKPDGTLCYTVTVENGGRGSIVAFTYSGPAGEMVARVTDQNGLATVTCAGAVNPEVVMTACLGPAMATGGRGGGGNTCTAGTCM
jgi:hypothetical protein